ncbi:putative acetyltransferase [Halomonas sp. A3H3]|uniref:CatB-related O-acetyltransferase n=1 Tax=Halomonas sp. A3H3 TaxID=1346287 RepID=UPI00038D6BF0|nr:CatB-related O-acetyltransferase [Halomonas sp. A3H3]CDG56004.1 putative acetyltransferase [Halomonas sp. A3H3]|tara:strand:+ start:5144 stop:5935 length:792 start_codon:yes stop_codon:yes gene_type:complete
MSQISVNGNLVTLVWDEEVESFFQKNNFFLGYPWQIKGIIKHGAIVNFPVNLKIESFGCMAQGKFYSAGAFSYCRSKLITQDFSVGRYCSIAPGVELSDQDHPLDRVSTHSFTFKPHAKKLAKDNGKEVDIHRFNTLKKAPDIGNDVWIGKDALIKRGVKIGDGAVIAQRSIVTKSVPDYAIVAGSPARIVKYRFNDDVINKLKEIRWWDYSFFDFSDINVTDVERFLELFSKRLSVSDVSPLPGKVSLLQVLSENFNVMVMQ